MSLSSINFQTNVANAKAVNFKHNSGKMITPNVYTQLLKEGCSYNEAYLTKGYRYISAGAAAMVYEKFVDMLMSCLEKNPDNPVIKRMLELAFNKSVYRGMIKDQKLASPEVLEKARASYNK